MLRVRRRKVWKSMTTVGLVAVLLVAAAYCQAAEYEIIDLGTLGEAWSETQINDAGWVVGHSIASGEARAFLWLPEPAYGLPAGMNDLGTLAGARGTHTTAINDAGQVVGVAAVLLADGAYHDHAFLWLPEPAYGLPAGMNDLVLLCQVVDSGVGDWR